MMSRTSDWAPNEIASPKTPAPAIRASRTTPEMAALEHGVGANGSNGTAGGFRAFGKNYASEREAVLTFWNQPSRSVPGGRSKASSKSAKGWPGL